LKIYARRLACETLHLRGLHYILIRETSTPKRPAVLKALLYLRELQDKPSLDELLLEPTSEGLKAGMEQWDKFSVKNTAELMRLESALDSVAVGRLCDTYKIMRTD